MPRSCLIVLYIVALMFSILIAALVAAFNIRPSQGQERVFHSKALCNTAADFAIRSEREAPTNDLELFKIDNPQFCLNATVGHPGYDGWRPALLIDQIMEGTTFVYVKYGEKWQKATGHPGRIIAVTRRGARNPT